ncbi:MULTISPECIES: flavodoxin family protein [Methanobacterium]|uniref:Flavodoxin n=1 Tax=Methanobacterium subterraneum TaxID=59277 RepID=A0A2H4VRD5_9EURY|nr:MULTISPECIES: flavodoxin family protein [Methanobacterium]AUB57469.1 flavodoxin [Methanobacterium sp. MZ-A1]AUB60590.1 flavodoxin [Methanobacterium subterraneum]MBW4258379.1 flavodoxin family protein [Methanobacterium sp. YSL]NMO09783.1 flavodoxin family protein [Methanobacterium subterraneum]
MKIIGINGSPRKNCNTAALIGKALEGAQSRGVETELIHLYDLNYKGCKSCFACKLKDGKSYGTCAARDDLTPVLKKIEETDAIILGSPIYLGTATGEMRSFLERLIFPYLVYDPEGSTLFPRRIPVGFIYTMGVVEELMEEIGYHQYFNTIKKLTERIIGESESLYVTDTYQFDDYTKYVSSRFNPEEKLKKRREVFPQDCEKAFQMGVRFTSK